MSNPHNEHHSTINRRNALGGIGVGAAAAVTLTACGSSESKQSLTDTKKPEQPTDVAAVADVPVGGAIKVSEGGLTVMLTQPTEGTFKAFSSVCTHQGCQLNVQNDKLACPCHASYFNIDDGSVTGGPAPDPLPEYTTEIKDGRIIVS